MKEKDTGTRKPLVFLFVLICHVLLLEALMRESKEVYLDRNETSESLLLYLIPRATPPIAHASKREIGPPRRVSPARNPQAGPAPDHTIMPPVETAPPSIDWRHEMELAAQNEVADADKQEQYRNLSKSMSPAQLNWRKQHHMEPVSNPGFTWKRPRIEVTEDGLPIVHVNDHCVLVPIFLIPMVFCSIGHIEPNGDLFDHMHDPRH